MSMAKHNLIAISASEPTYWPTDPKKIPDLLDFFITKGLTKLYLKAESCLDSSSDHSPVIPTFSTLVIHCEAPEALYNKLTDWDSFRDYVEDNINLKVALKTPEDVDDATKYITELIQEACWKNTPAAKILKNSENQPQYIKQKVLEKRRLRRVWHQSRLREDKIKFDKAATELRKMLHQWRDTTLETKLESLTATASTGYSLWKFTKGYDRPLEAKVPIRKNDNSWARTEQEKANTFAQHLAKVFTPNESKNQEFEDTINSTLNQAYQLSPPPKPATVREVWRLIRDLKDKKAPGFDLITKEVLKELPKKAVVFLTTLFNGILRTQHYPILWKVSQIVMTHKLGKPANEVASYRPISLLPTLSKLFEKVLLRRILPILTENNTIPDHQFGFRLQHSTIEQAHRVCDKIRKTLEDKEYCSAAFLDVQQAFDRVWHEGLLYKIRMYLPHCYFPLLKSYLTNRLFQVKEADARSSLYEIRAGVPQGSVLGPVLYTLFTADLPIAQGVTTATYADDTAILASDKDPVRASVTLQNGLDQITKWLQRWRIKASASKSIHATFALRKGNCPPVQLENTTLPHSDCVKYLGVHLDRHLTWKQHIKAKREELKLKYKDLYWLVGRNTKLSIDNKLLIYKTILKPVWMYCIQLWGSACDSNISMLQRLQNIILRNIANVPWYVTNAEIHQYLEVNTVKEEIHRTTQNYIKRLENHPNELAAKLIDRSYNKRLKRKDILQLA